MSKHKVILLLGSNLGAAQLNLEEALKKISKTIGEIQLKTEVLISAPVEFVSKNNFCNIAVEIKTELSPILLIDGLKKIEKEMGRLLDTSVTKVYKDRVIDVDVVSYDNLLFESRKLQLPHQLHLFEREFSRTLLNELNTLKHNI